MTIPDWYEILLLALAAWRTFHLVAYDTITDRPRRYITRMGSEWKKQGDPVPKNYRFGLHDWMCCPYCAGFWNGLIWFGFFQLFEHGTLVVAVPFALSAGIVAAHRLLSSE